MEHRLRRWWCRKYNLPPTHEAFLAYTEEELLVEFYEDYYEEHKAEALEVGAVEGDVQFVTGDPEIDALEKRMAEGSITDEEVQRILASWSGDEPPKETPAPLVDAVEDIGDGFHDERPA